MLNSKYFKEVETTVSATGKSLKIKNVPNEQERNYIQYTASRMDHIRELLGVPLIVLSWFRCEELNKAVKGSKTSAHRFGLAVDVHSNQMTSKEIYEKALKLKQQGKIQFDQLIYYPKQNFVHFGFKLDQASERGMNWINN
ncbi:D-Ala-D-Ala carboxypeptidase family metallohydrolase [Fusobacterium sp.]|uniref:D-Ala-D-Ala carboxypeptidase family metallohydrolase n=1 Tax=Fusobacterium sp. TaxID=68766 RepID=UPI0025C28542|nr:D-Ala-D-Ala carboxypeptidase family metallohydrolase [Fusobacterium sp.]